MWPTGCGTIGKMTADSQTETDVPILFYKKRQAKTDVPILFSKK
jgi:hypothetical protein